MNPPIVIYLAVEDDLSERVLSRLLRERPVNYEVKAVFKGGGFGYLKKKSRSFNTMAKRILPVLLLTDLDQHPCPPGLLNDWLDEPKHQDFLLRVAVREVEAWLLASDAALGTFLRSRRKFSFPDPETLSDPKLELLKVATQSPRRDLREAIVRRDQHGRLRQGPAYNSTLASFVERDWAPDSAQKKCASLAKVIEAFTRLERRWKERG